MSSSESSSDSTVSSIAKKVGSGDVALDYRGGAGPVEAWRNDCDTKYYRYSAEYDELNYPAAKVGGRGCGSGGRGGGRTGAGRVPWRRGEMTATPSTTATQPSTTNSTTPQRRWVGGGVGGEGEGVGGAGRGGSRGGVAK